MARDRKRAKQRQQRRTQHGLHRRCALRDPARADVPGALEHASGEVDEFDAALVRGAAASRCPPTPRPSRPSRRTGKSPRPTARHRRCARRRERRRRPPRPRQGGRARAGGRRRRRAARRAPAAAAGDRAIAFLRASWAELQRVQWPDRRQVTQATAVVLGFVAVAGIYLGVADYVAKEDRRTSSSDVR